jgi:hypothetical protein
MTVELATPLLETRAGLNGFSSAIGLRWAEAVSRRRCEVGSGVLLVLVSGREEASPPYRRRMISRAWSLLCFDVGSFEDAVRLAAGFADLKLLLDSLSLSFFDGVVRVWMILREELAAKDLDIEFSHRRIRGNTRSLTYLSRSQAQPPYPPPSHNDRPCIRLQRWNPIPL